MSNKPDVIIVNASLQDREGPQYIRLRGNQIEAIEPMREPVNEEDLVVYDAEGGLALPAFVESHLHYDSALTAGQPRWNRSGTLFEGIRCNAERQAEATAEDYVARATQMIKRQVAQGVQYCRTHVDVSDSKLVALDVMLDLKARMKPWIDIQVVAFPQLGIMGERRYAQLLEEALVRGADGVGAIPHYEMTREHGVQSVQLAFELAEKYDRFVDIHCDETDDEQARFVEVVAAEAALRGWGKRTTASHVTAMHSYNNAYAAKLIDLIRRSGMNIVSNPLSNVSLQGRFDSFPVRRGIARVKPLLEAGVNVSFGNDNVQDAFYPLGNAGMIPALSMGLHLCHMLGYEDLQRALDLVTVNGARTLGLGENAYGLQKGKPANLAIMHAQSPYECLVEHSAVKYSFRGGRLLAETTAPRTQWHDPQRP